MTRGGWGPSTDSSRSLCITLSSSAPDTPSHAPAQGLVIDKVMGLPAEDVDVSVATGHRDAELHV